MIQTSHIDLSTNLNTTFSLLVTTEVSSTVITFHSRPRAEAAYSEIDATPGHNVVRLYSTAGASNESQLS